MELKARSILNVVIAIYRVEEFITTPVVVIQLK